MSAILQSSSRTLTTTVIPAPSIAFSASLTLDGGGNANRSIRNVLPNMAFGGTKVRLTFQAGNAANPAIVCSNVSIGIQSSTYNTAATPIELLFSGAHGFSLNANQSIISDWAALTIASTNNVIVILDVSATGSGFIKYASVTATAEYYLNAVTSYNQAAPAGSWTNNGTFDAMVSKIEVTTF